jgi:guanylate kinase
LFPEALLIFLTVENEAELRQRLKLRRTEPLDKLEARVATARQELECIDNFDYLVLNPKDRLDEAVDTITSIIQAEHQRVRPRKAKT